MAGQADHGIVDVLQRQLCPGRGFQCNTVSYWSIPYELGSGWSDLHWRLARPAGYVCRSIVIAARSGSATRNVRSCRNVLRVHNFVVPILLTNLFLVFSVRVDSDVPLNPAAHSSYFLSHAP